MQVSFDASDLNNLAADLGDAATRVGARASQVVRATAFRVESDAKEFAPFDTGHLQNSIGTDVTGDGRSGGMTAVIGPSADYGHFLEFGTSRMAPHAFMGPALDRNTPAFVQAMQQIAGEALQ